MFNIHRFLAVVKARNIEFFRDKSSLGWNLLFPVLLLVGFSFVFSNENKALYKVGVIEFTSEQATQFTAEETSETIYSNHPFLTTPPPL